ncbi:MAG: type I glyceraldehyde-3-phosphate dehydrogenase [Candidatus Dojkabacteria bacterium]
MAKRVAINGFGRIGRLVFRALLERDMLDGEIEVVAVNDLVPAENLAYLLKYDTTHGKLNMDVKAIDDNTIQVGKYTIKTLALKANPSELPWKDMNIDIVIESTGFFTKKADAMGHITAGAKKVIISAPSDEDVKTILMGVNHEEYQGEDLISNASCTTNCLAPIVHVLLKEGIGLEEGLMTTSHAYTASQSLMDGPSKKAFRDGRAGAMNVIPATTGAAKAIGLVIPEMKGKLTGMSLRVPVSDVSVVDLTFKPAKETSMAEINAAMKKASETYLKGVLNYTEEPVVSSDFIHDPASSTYDATAGIELNSRFFKIIAWYDNEWGYSNRMADLLKIVVEKSA